MPVVSTPQPVSSTEQTPQAQPQSEISGDDSAAGISLAPTVENASPQTSPESFGGLSDQMQGSPQNQEAVLRIVQRDFGNQYTGAVLASKQSAAPPAEPPAQGPVPRSALFGIGRRQSRSTVRAIHLDLIMTRVLLRVRGRQAVMVVGSFTPLRRLLTFQEI